MEFTKEQLEAIGHDGPFLAVTAGAGSGKTRVLVERICRCLREKKASLNDILAVTFTEKAAAELKERVAKVVNDDLALAGAYIGTLHSFCARILRERAPQVGIDPDFSIMEQHASGILLRRTVKETIISLLEARNKEAETLIEELDLKGAVSCVCELLQYRWHTERLAAPSMDNANELDRKDHEVRNAALFCYKESLKNYERAKAPNLDFSDLEIFAIELLKDKETSQRLRRRFKYIFVDEFQDVNDVQARIIELLYDGKKNALTVVGDMKQSIYRFRGANVHEFENAVQKAGQTVTLSDNFRSTPSILSYINGLFPEFEPLRASREDIRESVLKMEIQSGESASADERRKAEAERIADIVTGLKGVTACLFSSLNSLDIYTSELAGKSVPYMVYGGHGFLDLSEVSTVISALKLISDRKNAPALLGVARSKLVGLTDDEIYLMCTDRNQKGEQDIEKLFKKVFDHRKAGFLRTIFELAPLLSISELIRQIGGRNENIEKLAGIAASIEDREQMTLDGFLDYIESLRSGKNRLAEFPADGESRLVLMTIHQAKGLEFDNVILADTIRRDPNNNQRWVFLRGRTPGLAFKVTPFDNPEAEPVASPMFERIREIDEHEEEDERSRLLYVALTRAKERLIIPLHPQAKGDGTWHKRLIEACGGLNDIATISLASSSATNETNIATSENPGSNGFAISSTIFTPTKLEDFVTCPIKYRMKHILGIPEGSMKMSCKGGLPANVQGDIVHKMIENHAKGMRPDIKKICLEMAITGSDLSKEELSDIQRHFDNFLKSDYANARPARHEVPFFFALGNDHIEGKIDMLMENEDSWEIVDFKTGNINVPKEKIIERYDIQIRTYALAVAKNSGICDGKVSLLLLSYDSPVVISREISRADIEATEKGLKEIINRMSRLSDNDIKGCGECIFCRGI